MAIPYIEKLFLIGEQANRKSLSFLFLIKDLQNKVLILPANMVYSKQQEHSYSYISPCQSRPTNDDYCCHTLFWKGLVSWHNVVVVSKPNNIMFLSIFSFMCNL